MFPGSRFFERGAAIVISSASTVLDALDGREDRVRLLLVRRPPADRLEEVVARRAQGRLAGIAPGVVAVAAAGVVGAQLLALHLEDDRRRLRVLRLVVVRLHRDSSG